MHPRDRPTCRPKSLQPRYHPGQQVWDNLAVHGMHLATAPLPVPLPASVPPPAVNSGMGGMGGMGLTAHDVVGHKPPDQGRTGAKPFKVRTPEEITSAEGAQQQHDVRSAQEPARAPGFAVGPLAAFNADGLLEVVKKVCTNTSEGGGGWRPTSAA